MKSEQYSSGGGRVQDTCKTPSFSIIYRRINSQLSDIKISLSPHKGKQTNPQKTQNKYKVITSTEGYLEITLWELEFVLIFVMHMGPALPSSPLQLSATINATCNCSNNTGVLVTHSQKRQNSDLKYYVSSWSFMWSQAFILIFKQLTRSRNPLILCSPGQFLAHATSFNCASK